MSRLLNREFVLCQREIDAKHVAAVKKKEKKGKSFCKRSLALPSGSKHDRKRRNLFVVQSMQCINKTLLGSVALSAQPRKSSPSGGEISGGLLPQGYSFTHILNCVGNCGCGCGIGVNT